MITRRRYMREVTDARRAYRYEADEREAKVAAKEREVDRMLNGLVRANLDRLQSYGHGSDDVLITLRVTSRALLELPGDAIPRLARLVADGLLNARKDYRPDMREVDRPRLLTSATVDTASS